MEESIKKDEEGIPQNEVSELEECNKKCEEYLNNWKRSAADFLNYKKDEMERMAMLVSFSKEDMILKILPILDNFYLAEKELPKELTTADGGASWTKGFLQIQNQIKEFLKKEGIEEIKTIGKKFDPSTMEIMEEVEGGDSGNIIEELQKGYMMNGKVLRPARVKISK